MVTSSHCQANPGRLRAGPKRSHATGPHAGRPLRRGAPRRVSTPSYVHRGHSFPAAINVGRNPTFAEAVHKVEVHVIGLDASIYAEPLEVDFLARLRDIQQFAGVDELKTQLAKDVSRAAEIGG